MRRLYFDTETTGFPRKAGAPLEDCPHIVQLAAIVIDDQHGEIASMNVIIRPNGYEIPEKVTAIHGISTETAMECGVPISSALTLFEEMIHLADQVVAHNLAFDNTIVAYAFDRLDWINPIPGKDSFCTMEASTAICQLPGKFPGKFKWPKLTEAHIHFFGESFDGAHDALVDVRACHRVHAHLLTLQPQ